MTTCEARQSPTRNTLVYASRTNTYTDDVGFEESLWVQPKGGKYGEDIYVSTHVDDCLICCKSTTTMSKFKQELLTRFQETDEGEVKEYLGCELIRDRAARTDKMAGQAGYAERVHTGGAGPSSPLPGRPPEGPAGGAHGARIFLSLFSL